MGSRLDGLLRALTKLAAVLDLSDRIKARGPTWIVPLAAILCAGWIFTQAKELALGGGFVMMSPTIYQVGNAPEHPNEPAGFAEILDNPFNDTTPTGWTCFACTNLSIKDTTQLTIQSSPNVGQILYPNGFAGGSAPVNLVSPSFGADSVYFHFTVTYSSSFDSHTVGTKLTFIKNDTHGDTYFHASGGGLGTLTFEIRTQGAGHPDARNYRWNDGDNEVSPSIGDATLTRGTAQEIEVVLIMDSAVGAGDGEIHAWIDNTKILQFTAVNLRRTGDDDTFDGWQLNPTYGGGNTDTVPSDQWIYIDHIYLSGK